jgi:hypothetical protein
MFNDDEHQTRKHKELCENCYSNEHKYKCPRCSFKSCSLICVKEHKRVKQCTGIKDKYTKQHIKEFKENDYYRDMNYLNQAINDTNRHSKTVFHLEDKSEEQVLKEKKHKNLKKLAKKFRNVTLECSPSIMEKFKENQSYCDSKLKKFFWTVKFIFTTNDVEMSHLFPEPVDDAIETLSSIYDTMLKNTDRLEFNLLQHVNTLNKDTIKFLYKDVSKSCEGNILILDKVNYVIIDRNTPLKDVLNGKTVFEYVEIYIK